MLSVLANLGEMVLSDGRQSVVIGASQRRHAERRAGKGTPTSGQFSRWGPAQPAEGGRREGPRVQGWFASRPEPRRSASSGRVRGTRLSLRFAQRCRPPPGELAGGRRSRAGTPSGLLGFPRGAAFSQQLAGVPLPAEPSGPLDFPAGRHFHSNGSRGAGDFVGGMRHSGGKPQRVRCVSSLIRRPPSIGTGWAQVGLSATS